MIISSLFLFTTRSVSLESHKAALSVQAFAASVDDSDFGESDHSLYFVTALYCWAQFSCKHFTNLLNSSESLYFSRRLELVSLEKIKNKILLCQVNFNATNSIPRTDDVVSGLSAGIRRVSSVSALLRHSPFVLLNATD